MTYKQNFQTCPYRTSDGKCTHKHCDNVRSKRKRACGYSKPEQCGLYTDWVEINKSCERASSSLLDYNKIKGEDETITD